jgi:hypothetical protein
MNKKTALLIGTPVIVVSFIILFWLLSVAVKDYAIDVDPIKDSQNLFSTSRVTITNIGKLPITNIKVNYGDNKIEKILTLSPGQKMLLSPPSDSVLKSVLVTADHGLMVARDYRTPLKLPGMMGS